MLKGKKFILFDMDGTLIDSVGMWNEVDRLFIKALGGNPDGVDVQSVRDTKLREYKASSDPYREYCGYIGKKYGSSLLPDELVKLRYSISLEFTANTIDYKPYAEKFLHALKSRGYTLAIVSTTKRSNMEVYRTKNANIISKAPIDKVFSKVYTREDAKEIKPSPEIYIRVLSELGAKAEECLIFEDSLVGVEAANCAGIDVVAMYDKYSDNDKDKIISKVKMYFNDYKEALRAIGAENEI